MTNEGIKNRGCGIPTGHGLLKIGHTMRTLPLVAASIAATAAAHAVIVTEPTRTYAVGYNLADVVNPGAFFQQTISDSAIVSLTDVRVGLHLVGRGVGGFAGEMVVSLNKDLSVTSVLLNRVGVSAGNSFGFGYDGWNVTLADGGIGGDIHEASLVSGILTGEFAPDGRTSPASALRPALLNVFNGGTGNGDWYLSVADVAAGGTMRLESWSLTLTGENGVAAVPEAGTWFAGMILAGCVGLRTWRRPG